MLTTSKPRSLVPVPTPFRNSGCSSLSAARLGSTVCRSSATRGRNLELSLVDDIRTIGRETWDECAGDDNPLHSYAFLSAIERSNSACIKSGWAPQHIWVTTGDTTVAVVPLYLKGNSYGEYVFDSAFAELWHASLPDMPPADRKAYYPKLLSAVPFTPCTCSKLLINKEQLSLTGMGESELMMAVADTMRTLPRRMGVSSLHVNFTTVDELDTFSKRGFIARTGMQYHWTNEQYSSFDDFLARLKQSRRKTIRQERRKVNERLHIRRLTGDELKSPALWDAFFEYYLNTVCCAWWLPVPHPHRLAIPQSRSRSLTRNLPSLQVDSYWANAYLSREFFSIIADTMADQTLLVAAYDSPDDVTPIAAALNFIGKDTLYGRNWGCRSDVNYPGLHMELCYYQAQEFAIERRLSKVEAGAQGEETKLPRGYLPTLTHSAHVFDQVDMSAAINNFCVREGTLIREQRMDLLRDRSPFKSVL